MLTECVNMDVKSINLYIISEVSKWVYGKRLF